MRKYSVLIGCGIALILFLFWYYLRHPLTTKVSVGNANFLVEVAVTGQEKERGLAYRDSLAPDRGMLFVYNHDEQYSFWMKGMRFPIDILWIKDNEIIDISKNVPLPTNKYLPRYSPKLPANKVLEINAGLSDKLGVKIGDRVSISN